MNLGLCRNPLESFSCNIVVSSLNSAGEDTYGTGSRTWYQPSSRRPSFLIRTATRVSRAKWFMFLRRVFHYQNGSSTQLGSNPFNSTTWMKLELLALFIQLSTIIFSLTITQNEKPVWPMRIWIIGYSVGCVLSLLLLYSRFRGLSSMDQDDTNLTIPDLEQQRISQESRYLYLITKCRSTLELFFAIWFVMGNVWIFDSRLGSFQRAPKLHALCIMLLAWNALCYSFPFLLFVLLCCIVPLIGYLLGYNMNKGSVDRRASDDQISSLPRWRYKELATTRKINGKVSESDSPISCEVQECCICLTKYKEDDDIRQLPCTHLFHLNCVDQWLRIVSCCPLCKQGLDT